MNQVQNNTKGIIFILIGMASFSIQDSLIKFIYNDTALYELYFGRTLVASLLLIIFKSNFSKTYLKNSLSFFDYFKSNMLFFWFQFLLHFLTFMSLAMANALFFQALFLYLF